MAVYGISRDSIYSHRAWRQVHGLDFPLLSDWNAEAVRAFEVAGTYRGMTDTVTRSAFLVDGGGIIRGAWQYEPQQVPDFDELLEAARSVTG